MASVDNVVEKRDKPVNDEDEDELFDEQTPFELEADEVSLGLDDEVAIDLDIGIQVNDLLERDTEGEWQLELDLSSLVESAPDSGAGADDETGPLELDPSMGIQEPLPEDLEDSSLGFDDSVELHLPEAGASTPDGDDEILFNDWELELPDEVSLDRSGAPWREVYREPGRYEALLCVHGRVFAGGEALLMVEREDRRLVPAPSALIQLQPHPLDPDGLFASTRSGTLLALRLGAQDSWTPVEWRARLSGSEGPAGMLSLACWRTGSDRSHLVVLTPSGNLLKLSPETLEVTPLATSARAIQLPAQADRPALLGQSPQGVCLLQAPESTGPFLAQPLDNQLERALALGPCTLIVWGPYIALSGPRHGLLVSQDCGGSFARVPGCVAVSASVLGSYLGTPHLWLTLNHEVANRSELALLDMTTLRVTTLADFESSDGDDFAPVRALAWDPTAQVLYAAGDFGVRGFAPPKGDA